MEEIWHFVGVVAVFVLFFGSFLWSLFVRSEIELWIKANDSKE